MTAYREDDPVQVELRELRARVEQLEARPVRQPFAMRYWHAILVCVGVIGAAIVAYGFLYDHMRECGLRASLFVTLALVGLVALLGAIALLCGSEGNGGLCGKLKP